MLRSLFNSIQARSAGAGPIQPHEPRPYTFQDFTPPPEPAVVPPPIASTRTLRPERCCVYCGHGLYALPRIQRMRCPKCFQDILVTDITLTGEVHEKEFVTAGKIAVALEARVAADLIGCTVEITGRVLGNVLASQTCRVRSTGKLAGQILCRRLEIEPGGEVQGQLELVNQ